MTLPIGILGAGGAAPAQFLVPQLVTYSGGEIHEPIIAFTGAQQLAASLTAYSSATIHAPVIGNAIAASLATYSGATIHAPLLDGVRNLNASLVSYSGATIRAPSLAETIDLQASLTAYSGATIQAPALTSVGALSATLVTYSGGTIHDPVLLSAKISILDAWQEFTTETGTFDISEGENRFLTIFAALEGSGSEINVNAPTYGGQTMSIAFDQDVGGNRNVLLTMGEAKIDAAVGNAWDLDLTGPGVKAVSIAVYDHVNQESPIFASDRALNLSGNTADFSIGTVEGGALIAHALSGNASVFAWDAPLIERTDQSSGTVTGSAAALVDLDGSPVTVGATGSGITPNRSGIIATVLRPTDSKTLLQASLAAYAGATVHEPTIEPGKEIQATLVTYSGATIHAPTIAEGVGPDVAILNAWTELSDADPFTPSVGTNRLLVVCVHAEASDRTIDSVDFGDQTLTNRLQFRTSTSGFRSAQLIATLDEAGIAAATGNSVDVTLSAGGAINDLHITVAVYENVDQTNPIFASDSSFSDSGQAADLSVATENGGYLIGHGGSGTTTSFTWTAPLIEQTDTAGSSAQSSVAHVAGDGDTETVSASAGSPPRSTLGAISLRKA